MATEDTEITEKKLKEKTEDRIQEKVSHGMNRSGTCHEWTRIKLVKKQCKFMPWVSVYLWQSLICVEKKQKTENKT